MRKLFSLFVALLATTTLFAQRFQAGDLFYEVVNEDITLEKPYVSNPGYGHTTVVLYIPENTPAGCYAVGTVNGWNVSNTDFMFTPVKGANSERWVACTFEYYSPIELYVLAIPSEPNFPLGWSFQWDSPAEDNVVILEGAGSFIYYGGESKLGDLEDNAVIYIEIKKWANDPYIESVPCETAVFKHPWGGGDWLYREATKTAEATFELNAIYGNTGVNVATTALADNEIWYPTNQIEFVGDVALGDSVNFKFISEKRTIGRLIITLIEKGNGTNNLWYVPSKNFPTAPQKRSSANSSHQVVVTYQHERSTENYQHLTIANIPATVEYRGKTYDVVGIKEDAFAYSSIASISIPNSVTSIGDSAFANASLTSIVVPDNVTHIGVAAFADMEETLKSAVIGSGVKELNATFVECMSLESVILSEGLETIGDEVFNGCNSLSSINIPHSVTSIGYAAFAGCLPLESIVIPSGVTSIGEWAFNYCTSLSSVTCLAMTPSAMGEWVFDGCDNPTLFVLCNALVDYQAHEQWGQFANIECIGSEEVETDEVVIVSGTTTISITWPTEESANTYTIVIKKGDEVFCTLTFNADGQLLNITFAPSRDGNNHPVQYAEQAANGYRFTVTGLEEGTNYTYDITAKDTEDNVLQTYSGEFNTQSNMPTDVDNFDASTSNIQKLLRNGQLLILRDGKTYNAQGVVIM